MLSEVNLQCQLAEVLALKYRWPMISLTSSLVMSVSLAAEYAFAMVSSSAGFSCPLSARLSIFRSASSKLLTCTDSCLTDMLAGSAIKQGLPAFLLLAD